MDTGLFYGPSDWSRTSGLLNPIQARYQTAPHPDNFIQPYYFTIKIYKVQDLFKNIFYLILFYTVRRVI